jgi:hypothetical protein
MDVSYNRVSFKDELLLGNCSAVSTKSDEAIVLSVEASITLNYY